MQRISPSSVWLVLCGVLRTRMGGTAISQLTFSHHLVHKNFGQDMSVIFLTELLDQRVR